MGTSNCRLFAGPIIIPPIIWREGNYIETLATHAGVKSMMQLHGLHAKKRLGQHFLTDQHVLGKIIQAADIGAGDAVLEVGPGLGGLTQALAGSAGHVYAVELDAELIPVLSDIFRDIPNVTICQGDILGMDITSVFPGAQSMSESLKAVANLPYYITTPVIMHLLESGVPFKSIVVMVQKEVAKRLTAKPSTKDYGALTLAVQYRANAEVVANVPRNCFLPRPEVDSAVVRLTPKTPAYGDSKLLFWIIRAAFGQRRKTLVNALFSGMNDLQGPSVAKDTLIAAVRQCGFNEDVRGEALSLYGFIGLAKALQSHMITKDT